jgi:VWFA-related protein
MQGTRMRLVLATALAAAVVAAAVPSAQTSPGASRQGDDAFRFKSGVELVNVNATVSDDDGHFVSGLTKDDFTIYEDGERRDIASFSNERVPVSLGILLDTSGSMTPEKMSSARAAIDRFVFDLLGADDELFFMQFASVPDLVQGWTSDRGAISRAVRRVMPGGGTAMYDAIARALPIAADGRNQKKALLVISDGNDTNSRTPVSALRNLIRESEVMVYALGVDGTAVSTSVTPPTRPTTPRFPVPFPNPGDRGRFPGGRFPGRGFPGGRALEPQAQFPPLGGNRTFGRAAGERVNEDALRAVTDDTGGRTEIVRGFGDLDAATAHIADELSKQYYLGYNNAGVRDGRWHAITVEPRDRRLRVRARRGYVAS